MRSKERRGIIRKYERKIRAATERALNGETADQLKADMGEIDNYAKLLALPEHRWTADAGLAVLFALLCLAVASTLWAVKHRSNNVSLAVDTGNLRGRLAVPWSLPNPFSAPLLHLERASKLSAPNIGLSIDAPDGNAWLRLDGGTASLVSLELKQDAVLDITFEENDLRLLLSQQPLRGTIRISGKGTLTAGTNTGTASLKQTYRTGNLPPESLEFEVADPGHVPTQITLHAPQKWGMGRVPLRNLNFLSEEMRGVEAEFTSGVKFGSLTFNDMAWPAQSLSEGDAPAVGDLRTPVEIREEKGLIHVSFNGIASEIKLGQGETERELAPSYLEYLYNKKKLSFFWGATIGIWGVLWGIRKTIFR